MHPTWMSIVLLRCPRARVRASSLSVRSRVADTAAATSSLTAPTRSAGITDPTWQKPSIFNWCRSRWLGMILTLSICVCFEIPMIVLPF